MTAAITSTRPTPRSPARMVGRTIAIAVGALALAFSSGAQAQRGFHGGGYHGGYHGGYYRGGGWGYGPFWGVVGLGLGLGIADTYYYDRPNYVVVDQPPYYYGPAPAPVAVYPSTAPQFAPAPQQAPMADPIFYPRNGQSGAQVEADRRACNSWATTQPRAMSDASIFQRATFACMDGRGYTAR